MAIYKDVEPLEVVAYKGESEDFDRGVTFILEQLDALPTADVAEVKHGEWVYKPSSDELGGTDATYDWMCSVCKDTSVDNTDFCPNCGAKMDGGKAE